jgi:starch-binding outer membrane protein, SusD/RagB family
MKKLTAPYRTILLIVLFISLVVSCGKYLDLKPGSSQVVLKNMEEARGLLNNYNTTFNYPVILILVDDNLYYSESNYNRLSPKNQQCYIWDPATDVEDVWVDMYGRMVPLNAVIQFASDPTINASAEERNQVKGPALFLRGFNYFTLSQIFVPPYSRATADLPLGMPLRIYSNVQDPQSKKRSTVQQTYDQVLSDLKQATSLLPTVPLFKTWPSKAAALGMLARVYLVMSKYDSALHYAQLSLQQNNSLMDYADNLSAIHAGSAFSLFNPEVDFPAVCLFNKGVYSFGGITPEFYQSYDTNDLRKILIFFKGSYSGDDTKLFCGISTGEVYLIVAECYARLGRTENSADILNALLQKRWAHGTYSPYTGTNQIDILKKILEERRKELAFRPGLRWSDLRRLNSDANFAQTIHRTINGKTFTLQPNDKKYTFRIPENIILTEGLEQNPK